jgi:glycerophosphoryl diester phosphodiesterase
MFGIDQDLRTLSSKEILKLPTYNSIYQVSGYSATRFLDIADSLLEKAFINLDRCWDFLDVLLPQLQELTHYQKILLKTPVKPQWLEIIAKKAPDIPYMPIVKTLEDVRIADSYNLNIQAVELIFPTLDHELVAPQTIQGFLNRNLLPFVNAIDLGQKYNLSAGLTDTGAILEGEELHWGKLIDMGFLIIQTDWPLLLKLFFQTRI